MLELIITVALVGVLVWLVTTYLPMPQGFKTAIYAIAIICVVVYLLRVLGLFHGADLPVPQLK